MRLWREQTEKTGNGAVADRLVAVRWPRGRLRHALPTVRDTIGHVLPLVPE